MANPDRPQYQETIASAWGQSVADHVVRRYATTAERDADLAGVAKADLAGQVVAIIGAGRAPYLEVHDGTQWVAVPTGFDMQSETTGVLSDANAHAQVNFPRPFAGVPTVVWSDGSMGAAGVYAFIGSGMMTSCTASGFSIRPQGIDGVAIVNQGVAIGWVASYRGAPSELLRPVELDDGPAHKGASS